MKTQKISDELRNEIIAAVESANVSSPAEVCDWVLDAAASGQDWRAELARAVDQDQR